MDEGEELNPSIWGHLPEHLLEQIIARLPIVALLRCRTLSKTWRTFINSPPFLHRLAAHHGTAHSCMQGAPTPPWFLMFANHDYEETCTYDPCTNCWYRIPLPSFSISDERHIPVASAGGLVCFTSSVQGHKAFTVCNPLTRAWRKLPPMLNPLSFLETVGMVITSNARENEYQSSYKVIVAGNHDTSETSITTEVYDSSRNVWESTSTMPPNTDPMLSAVACNGSLYSWCCNPDGLLSYNLLRHSWTHVPTSTPHSSSLISNTIISWQGRLFMLGRLHENEITTSISVWELVTSPAKHPQWVIVDTMPSSLLLDFLGRRTFFMCVGCQGLVLLHVGRCAQDMPMLLYDITKKSWQKLPICSLLEDRFDDGLIDGIAYVPQLYASP